MAIAIDQFLIILVVAAIVAIVAKYIRWPYTIALLVSGLVVAAAGLTTDFVLDRDTIFHILLPPLLFEGALHMRLRHLRDNAKIIGMLAIPGLIGSAFLVGLLIWLFTNNVLGMLVGFPVALLTAIIIIPTDPISILAIYKEQKVPNRLKNIIEGESIFDDGTALVLFAVVLELILSDNLNIVTGIIDFLRLAIFGILLGIAAGYIAFWLISRIDDKFTEVMITLILVFGLFALAESMEASGVFAVVMAGLILGNYGTRFAMAPSSRHSLLNFWGFITFLVNSFLFILVGMNVDLGSVADELPLVIFCVLALWAARALTVMGIGEIVNHGKQKSVLPRKWQFIMWWGGLRGAIPIALALSIPLLLDDGTTPFPHRETILAVTFGVVLITLLAQGLSLRPVLGRLGFQAPSKAEKDREDREIAALIKDTVDELAQLREDGEISTKAHEWLTHKFARSNSQLLTELGLLVQEHGIIPREEYNISVKETLIEKRKAVQEAWENKLISGAVGERLILEIDEQIQTLSTDDDLAAQPTMPGDFFKSVTAPSLKPRLHSIEKNCGICLQPITAGESSTKCRCGTVFHNDCLTGVERCPICIAVLDKEQVKRETDVL